jgi:NADPH:quinone reductase-like Zn-dependent oxidoreductase
LQYLGYHRHGEPGEVLRLLEGPLPPLGPGMVLVELEATPVHIADLKAIRGELPFVAQGPGVPGFEGVGRIAATMALPLPGSGVQTLRCPHSVRRTAG